ncbi:MAG TPA: tetratricopeptide repeat protein [Bacteroidales bacterium]|nr:tetratricopeptide repeat protein [Bacteroidales bacterium]
MKKQLIYLGMVLVTLILFTSCNGSHERKLAEIDKMEKELWSDPAGLIDEVKADELLRAYLDYPGLFPEDTNAPRLLMKAGELMMSLKQPEQAAGIFKRLYEEYATHQLASDALFMEAFVSENDLRDLDRARELYNRFLQDNPAHPLAKDAAICLEHLGKTPEQILQDMQNRQAADSSLVSE